MATLFTRTIIIYILLILSLRIMGKRQLGELQASELVITFMLSELAVSPIQDNNIPLLYAIVPILFLLSVEVILSRLIMHCNPLKKLLCEKPNILVKDGKIDQMELARLRISVTELLSELRQKDIGDIEDVAYAILEENGKLSVFSKVSKQPPTAEDLNIHPRAEGIAHPVVIDGVKSPVNMTLADVSDKDIARELKRRNLTLQQVLLMTANDKKHYNIIQKDRK
ncbi:MAG: DUF421 domain-containing protein [Clostridia bacterium]|nr:DUF421 domain-containing protein [Clostridia bacterium]